MSYVIEDGIEVPPPLTSLGSLRTGPRTELTQALDALEVGQSVLLTDSKDYKAAMNFAERSRPKRFVFRKKRGWRVWRTE